MALLLGFFAYMIVCSWAFYKVPIAYQLKDYRKDRLYVVITLGVLMLIACIRGMSVGNDTSSYYTLFRYYGGITSGSEMSFARALWLDNMEIGYRYLNYLIHRLTDSYQVFLAIVSIFTYAVVIRFIRRYSTNVALSCVLFFLMFYGTYMNLLRQVLATSIVLLAFDALNKEKYLRFGIAVVFVAILFHKMAIIALMLIPMGRIKSSKTMLWIGLGVTLALVLLGRVPALMALVGITTSYSNVASGVSVLYSAVLNVLYLLTTLYLKNGAWLEEDEIETDVRTLLNYKVADNFISWIPYISLFFSVLAISIPVATRFNLYFSIFYLILIPEMMLRSRRSKGNKKLVLNVLMLALIAYSAGCLIFRPEWVTEFNYSFFWQTPCSIGGLNERYCLARWSRYTLISVDDGNIEAASSGL